MPGQVNRNPESGTDRPTPLRQSALKSFVTPDTGRIYFHLLRSNHGTRYGGGYVGFPDESWIGL